MLECTGWENKSEPLFLNKLCWKCAIKA